MLAPKAAEDFFVCLNYTRSCDQSMVDSWDVEHRAASLVIRHQTKTKKNPPKTIYSNPEKVRGLFALFISFSLTCFIYLYMQIYIHERHVVWTDCFAEKNLMHQTWLHRQQYVYIYTVYIFSVFVFIDIWGLRMSLVKFLAFTSFKCWIFHTSNPSCVCIEACYWGRWEASKKLKLLEN